MNPKHLPFVLLAAAPVAEPLFHHKKEQEVHAHSEAVHSLQIPTGVMVYGKIIYNPNSYSQPQTEARLVTLFLNDQS